MTNVINDFLKDVAEDYYVSKITEKAKADAKEGDYLPVPSWHRKTKKLYYNLFKEFGGRIDEFEPGDKVLNDAVIDGHPHRVLTFVRGFYSTQVCNGGITYILKAESGDMVHRMSHSGLKLLNPKRNMGR